MRELLIKALKIIRQARRDKDLKLLLKVQLSKEDYENLMQANLFSVLSVLTLEDVLEIIK